MARKHGRKGRLYAGLASDTAAAEPIAFLNAWDLDFSTDQVEVTAFEDENKTYVVGLPDGKGTFAGWYDDATVQTYTAARDGVKRKFYLYPSTALSTQYFFGEAFFSFKASGGTDKAIDISGDMTAASEWKKQG